MDSETLFLLAKSQAGEVIILSTPGAPTTGTWVTGNLALDSTNQLWVCVVGGTPGTWNATSVTLPWLTSTIQASNYTAANGDLVEATASLTVTSPTASRGVRFGVVANYAASSSSSVTITASSGYLIGPGIPASTSSITLGALAAHITFVNDGTNWIQIDGAVDSGWITPTLPSGWVGTVSYRMIGNRVTFKGEITTVGSSGTTLFSLTSNAQPSSQAVFSLMALGAAWPVYVQVTASVVLSYSGTTPGAVWFDGLSYVVG